MQRQRRIWKKGVSTLKMFIFRHGMQATNASITNKEILFPAIIFEIFLTIHLMINIFCEILGFTKLQAIITNFSSYFKANSQLVYSQRKLKLSRQRISFTQQLRFLRVSACVALLVFLLNKHFLRGFLIGFSLKLDNGF